MRRTVILMEHNTNLIVCIDRIVETDRSASSGLRPAVAPVRRGVKRFGRLRQPALRVEPAAIHGRRIVESHRPIDLMILKKPLQFSQHGQISGMPRLRRV